MRINTNSITNGKLDTSVVTLIIPGIPKIKDHIKDKKKKEME